MNSHETSDTPLSRSTVQYLLPEHALSMATRCDYTDLDGIRCPRQASNPMIYCFIEDDPVTGEPPQRSRCREFAGRLCEHCHQQLHLVIPPDNWWGSDLSVLLRLAHAEEGVLV